MQDQPVENRVKFRLTLFPENILVSTSCKVFITFQILQQTFRTVCFAFQSICNTRFKFFRREFFYQRIPFFFCQINVVPLFRFITSKWKQRKKRFYIFHPERFIHTFFQPFFTVDTDRKFPICS